MDSTVTNKPAAAEWRRPERGHSVAFKLIVWIALRLGRGFTRRLLYPIVGFFWITDARSRRASREFLSKALQPSQTPVSRWHTFKHLYVFAVTLLDRLYVLAGRIQQFDIVIDHEKSRDFPTSPQPGLFVISHLGSFDIMRILGANRRDFKIKFIMDRHQAEQTMRTLASINPEMSLDIIDAGEDHLQMMLQIKEAIADGYMVGLMGDRVFGQEAVHSCDFLGEPATFPLAPWQLALVLKVPVWLCFGLYCGGNQYALHLENMPLETTSTASPKTETKREGGRQGGRRRRQQLAEQATAYYAERLAHYAQLAPYNWFNFYAFWQQSSSK